MRRPQRALGRPPAAARGEVGGRQAPGEPGLVGFASASGAPLRPAFPRGLARGARLGTAAIFSPPDVTLLRQQRQRLQAILNSGQLFRRQPTLLQVAQSPLFLPVQFHLLVPQRDALRLNLGQALANGRFFFRTKVSFCQTAQQLGLLRVQRREPLVNIRELAGQIVQLDLGFEFRTLGRDLGQTLSDRRLLLGR